ncbi:hypothetical protein NSK_002838 [Nannochloropsis salina CCMP1776]|uniref:DNA helicase n=1 Tax=Nannochloropsis salina CCMP1776 TaxID=1027361 RepID=A0A4D9DBK5_9STRA|nr:hypothetical protein NSK_002838 [Nannochloropsis salina CCMP1776]|eukprot:TFJ86018.1 hypothetical protein NSK_002838 [Nannochloropsis salina CCMP1776]
MRRLTGVKRPHSAGAAGAQDDVGRNGTRRTSAPPFFMNANDSGSNRLSRRHGEDGIQFAESSYTTTGAAAPALAASEVADDESPAMDNTQEVIWQASPKRFRPMQRHSTGLVHKELSIIQDMLASKENIDQTRLFEQQSDQHHANQREDESSVRSIDGSNNWSDKNGDDLKHSHKDQEHPLLQQQPRASFSSSLLRNLLFRKSPAINRHACKTSTGDSINEKSSMSKCTKKSPSVHKREQAETAGEDSVAEDIEGCLKNGRCLPLSVGKRSKPGLGQPSRLSLIDPPKLKNENLSGLDIGAGKDGLWTGNVNTDSSCLGAASSGVDELAKSLRPELFSKNCRTHIQQSSPSAAGPRRPRDKVSRDGPASRSWEVPQDRTTRDCVGPIKGDGATGGRRFLDILEQIEEKLSQEEDGGGEIRADKDSGPNSAPVDGKKESERECVERQEKAKLWEEADDSNLWTDNDWAQILQLTQQAAPASSPPSALCRSVSSPKREDGAAAAKSTAPETPMETVAAAPLFTATQILDQPSPSPSCVQERPLEIPAAPPQHGVISLPTPSPADDAYPGLEEAKGYSRYRVEDVQGGPQGDDSLVVDALHLASGQRVNLLVGPPWSLECPPQRGNLVHIISTDPRTTDCDQHGRRKDGLLTVVDRTRNHLVLHPDFLVSPSSVIAGLRCDRRAVLQFFMSSSSGSSPVTMMGNLKHSLIQTTLLLLNERDRLLPRLADGSIVEEIERVADHVIQRFRVQLYGLRVPEAEARQELLDLIRPLVEWARLLYLSPPQDRQHAGGAGIPEVQVQRVQHVEESIWSSTYGLKGNIDATLGAVPQGSVRQQQSLEEHRRNDGEREQLLPLELKSGSAINETEHRGQVMLYGLLLQDRYGHAGRSRMASARQNARARAGDSGLLAYLRTTGVETRTVAGRESEIRQLLIVRNRVAQACMQAGQNPGRPLPPVLAHPGGCSKCFQVAECMVYHQAFEDGTAQSSAIGQLFDDLTGHLQEDDRVYLRKWDRLIGLEANASVRTGRELWHRRGAAQEERTSRCFSDMVCNKAKALKEMDGPAYLYRFARRTWEDAGRSDPAAGGAKMKGGEGSRVARSLHEMAIAVGDRVLVSTESLVVAGDSAGLTEWLPFQHVNLTSGNVSAISETAVEVVCSKAIAVPGYPDFSFASSSTSQAGNGQAAHHVSRGLVVAYQDDFRDVGLPQLPASKDVVVFRIDKDNTLMNFTTMRSNVMSLFTGPVENAKKGTDVHAHKEPRPKGGLRLVPTAGDEKRRRLIVHLQPPSFSQKPCPVPFDAVTLLRQQGSREVRGCGEKQLREEFSRLNPDQQRAVEKVLTAQDMALLLGMPGTGKTWTIAFVIRALVLTGKSVLITSYTHTGVDTVLLNLRECQVPFIRLGRAAQVQSALHDSLLEANDGLASMAALDAKLGTAQVVATTCLGVRHAALASRRFDVCIVDEAGQILEPVCLGPLRLATSFVLVGDHNQLPPLVASPLAAEDGMGESLFSRLSQAHPQAVQCLTFQYRMNGDIMSVCNSLAYANQLQCGDDSVANAKLELPRFDRLRILRADGACEVQIGKTGWLEESFAPHRSVLFLDTDGISLNPLEDGLVKALVKQEDAPIDIVKLRGNEGCVDDPTRRLEERMQSEGRPRWKHDQTCPSNLTNPTEARLVAQLVTALVLGGVPAENVAVISPLRSQLKLLRRRLQHVKNLEINTVDKLQGMDRDCIIISMVRSNAEGVVGHLLQDRRRINVAVSRARKKLLIVGSATTLGKASTTCELVDLMKARGWILSLPPKAHELYDERNLDAVSLLTATQ